MDTIENFQLDIAKASPDVEVEIVSELPKSASECPYARWDFWVYRCFKHPENKPLMVCLAGSTKFTCPYLKKEEGV